MSTTHASRLDDGSKCGLPVPASDDRPAETPRPRVLWIDDEVQSRDPHVRALEARGFDVDLALTLQTGLAMADEYRYAVLLLDLRMPDGDGLDALYSLARSHDGVPVIVLSAFADLDTAVAAMKLGAASVKAKPCDGDELVRFVREIVAGLGPPTPAAGSRVAAEQQEAVWLEHVCGRLSDCTSAQAQRWLLLRTMLHPDISLPAFMACAEALRSSRATGEPSLALRASRLKHVIVHAVEKGTPSHPRLRAALDELGTSGWPDTGAGLARHFNLSRAYFSHLLVAHTGLGVDEWRRAARMRRALRPVLESTEHVSQIAFQVGYEQASHFTEGFISTFGVPPTELRRDWAAQ